MKKVAILVSLLLGITLVQPAYGEDQKVVAIIDTAIDSNKITSVIYEACFTQNSSCPNGSYYMEGKGAALPFGRDGITKPLVGPIWPSSQTTGPGVLLYHGHNMVQTALATSSDIKIVFIRVADMTSTGSSLNAGQSLSQAINWVSKNASTYSIDAVSISQSRSNFADGTCPVDSIVSSSVKALLDQNIPTFAATGNDGLTTRIGFPACVDGVVAVGAIASTATLKLPSTYNAFAAVTNRGPGLDVVAQTDMSVTRYNGTVAVINGTSVANSIAASLYTSKNIDKNFVTFSNNYTKFLTYPYISR